MRTLVRCGSGQTVPAPARAAVLVRRRAALALAAAPLAVFAAMPASAASDGGSLLVAASLGDVAKLSAALAGGAAVESKNKIGNTALHEASRNGRYVCTALVAPLSLMTPRNTSEGLNAFASCSKTAPPSRRWA